MIILQNATIDHLRTLNADQLRNFWCTATYHRRRFAAGPGSQKYVQALANFASNLSTYMLNPDCPMYKDIAEKCANDAAKLVARYGRQVQP